FRQTSLSGPSLDVVEGGVLLLSLFYFLGKRAAFAREWITSESAIARRRLSNEIPAIRATERGRQRRTLNSTSSRRWSRTWRGISRPRTAPVWHHTAVTSFRDLQTLPKFPRRRIRRLQK